MGISDVDGSRHDIICGISIYLVHIETGDLLNIKQEQARI